MPTDDKHAVILGWAERVREASEEATPGPWEPRCRDVRNEANDWRWDKDEFLQFHLVGPETPIGRGDYHGPDVFLMASTASPDIAAAVREVVVLSMEHMATLDDYRGGLDDEDPEYVGASYEAVLDAEYRYKEALDRLAEVLRERKR